MHSPEAILPPHGHSLRSKRSRRPPSDDSIKLPRAKRRRSALRKDTFEPLSNISPNEVAARPDHQTLTTLTATSTAKDATNGLAAADLSSDRIDQNGKSSLAKDLTLRTAQKTKRRTERDGGAMKLSSNEFYHVEQMPALPEQIRSQPKIPYRATISSEHGYALALTHSESLIWNYHTSSSTLSTKELFSFQLPFQTAAPSDPLPIGSFAASSTSIEPGLVVVAPNQGHIVYWDTIVNASSFLPRQVSSGVQGFVPGMFSGETIKDITNAEPAGFVLSFSHGRVAHLTVKDQFGRPKIGVQFLRKNGGVNGGGLFGSIRNFVGGDRRKSVAAVRSGRAAKGQRDVLVASGDGEFEQWSTNLNGSDSLSFEMGLKDDLLDALKHNASGIASQEPHFKLLDFVVVEQQGKPDDPIVASTPAAYSLLLLASLTSERQSWFYIVEARMSREGFSIRVVHPISCYQEASSQSPTWEPRLAVPKPAEVAFVVFGTAIVIFSLAKIEATPSSQLLMEGQRLPEPFQDCIRFQPYSNYQVLGFSTEDKESQYQAPSCLLAVQGFGVVRAAWTASPALGEEPQEMKITLKSKMEQAIFYGTLRHNPLNLTRIERQAYPREEIEEAALDISQEILSSSSKYIPSASPSIDQHLKLRAKALEDLASHVQQAYGPAPRTLKWKLLSGAEKLAAARAMWRVQEEIMKRKRKEREETYWEQVLFFMPHEHRTKLDQAKGETDLVRLWLTRDVDRAFYMLNWLFEGHGLVQLDQYLDQDDVMENIRESCDLWIAGMDATYKFREDHASFYGLEDEIFAAQQGMLKDGYKDLPEIWTLDSDTVQDGKGLLDLVIETTKNRWEICQAKNQEESRRKPIVHMVHTLPKQIDLYRRSFTERCSWRLENEAALIGCDRTKKMREAGESCRHFFYDIAAFGLVQEAVELAERWEDMVALVELNAEAQMQAVQNTKIDIETSKSGADGLREAISQIQERSDGYFEKYGSAWANAQFNQMVLNGQLGSLLGEGQMDKKKRPYVTDFLRQNAGYRKIGWINDVLCERDFSQAAKTLESVATRQSDDTWAKKTAVCLAKLARLSTLPAASGSSAKQPSSGLARSTTKKFDDQLSLMDLQERLHNHVMSLIGPVIDDAGALQVAMEVFGKRIVGNKKTPALKAMLNDGLGVLLHNKVMAPQHLVDVLTLMDPVEYSGDEPDDPNVLGHEFWLALTVVRLAAAKPSDSEALARTIWRRAMIRDDWILLNHTTDKNDEEVTSNITQTSLFRTLRDYYEYVQEATEEASTIKLFSPLQILDAEIFPQSLQKQFRENERDIVRRDLEAECETLKNYVDKGRLEEHYGGLVKMAQEEAKPKIDPAGSERENDVAKP